MSQLPEGFELDNVSPAAAATSLPEGFALDNHEDAIVDDRGGFQRVADSLQHPLGAISRKVIEGAASIPEIGINLLNIGEGITSKIGGREPQFIPTPLSTGAGKLLDMANDYAKRHGQPEPYPEASGLGEKIMGGIAKGVTGGAGLGGNVGALAGGLSEGTAETLHGMGAPESVVIPTALAAGLIPGSITGAAVEAGGAAFNGIKNALAPASKGNIGKILASQMEDPAAVLAKLKQSPEVHVPGSNPTLAEVGGDNKLIAAQQGFENTDPAALKIERNANNSARQQYLGEVAGDEDTLAALKTKRAADTAPLREAAFNGAKPVDTKPALDAVEKILASPAGGSREVDKAMSIAKEAITRGGTDPARLYEARKDIANAIGGMYDSADFRISQAAKQLGAVRDAIDAQLEASAPGYKDYMTKYREMSKPIEQQQALQGFRERAQTAGENTLGEKSLSQPKVNNLLNAEGKAVLGKMLTKEQMTRLENLQADLDRQSQMNSVRPRGSDTKANFAQEDKLKNIINDIANSKLGKLPFGIGGKIVERSQAAIKQGLKESYADPYGTGALNLEAGLKAIQNQKHLSTEIKKEMVRALLGSSIGALPPKDAQFLQNKSEEKDK